MDALAVDSVKYRRRPAFLPLIPLLALPVLVLANSARLAPWQLMWSLALAIYAGLKWLTWAACPLRRRASLGRQLGYLMLWPGMNAKAFLDPNVRSTATHPAEWLIATANTALGMTLLLVIAPRIDSSQLVLLGWVGMTGIALALHFGLAHLLSLLWRCGGVQAEPLMNVPLLATSLSDFWGRRWNMAFRDVAFGQLFRPLAGRMGTVGATVSVFFASGVIHDLAISLPVRAGWGKPTLYFLLQAAGLLLERSSIGKYLNLRGGLRGRIACAAFVLLPVTLLFHQPFLRLAVLPTLTAIRSL